jgi:hypothetical protein
VSPLLCFWSSLSLLDCPGVNEIGSTTGQMTIRRFNWTNLAFRPSSKGMHLRLCISGQSQVRPSVESSCADLTVHGVFARD